jgi:hypothetical protein
MDSTTSGVLGIMGFLISGAGAIYAAINHKKIRFHCCGKDLDVSVDIDETEVKPKKKKKKTAKVAPDAEEKEAEEEEEEEEVPPTPPLKKQRRPSQTYPETYA